jgi:hypothetical protein
MSEKKQNPFKELELSMKDVPAHMKKKVMDDIAMAKLAMEMASLFTCNYKSTIEGMMKTNTDNKR